MKRVIQYFKFLSYFFMKNPSTLVGLVIISGSILLGIFSPLVTPYSPIEANAGESLQAPSSKHFFGTDQSGMDIFARVIYAIRTDLFIAISATLLSILIGLPIGVFAGFYSGRGKILSFLSDLIMRFTETMQAFPVFILAMILVAVLGPNKINLIIGIAFVNSPIFLRLIRIEILGLRERTFAEAAKSIGCQNMRIAFRHLLPNGLLPVLTQVSITMGFSIILTAGLSFIGAGVAVPEPEWGSMISIGAPNMMTGQWWPALFPGLALGFTVLGFALIGDGIQKLSDPDERR